jgi:outer membrane protein TolC
MRIMDKLKTLSYIFGIGASLLVSASVYAASPSASFASAPSSALTLPEVLRLAESYNPDLRAAKAQEVQAQKEITIQQSFYYPTLSLQGLASSGFPGSNQHGFIGTAGLVDSPFADAPVGGLVSKMDVLDLTIPFKVRSAQYFLEATKQHTEIIRYQVDWKALGYYFDSIRYLSDYLIWKDIYHRASVLQHTVERLVKTGQHNLSDEYLIGVQAGLAFAEQKAYHKRYAASLKNLALFLGKKPADVSVPSFKVFDAHSIKKIAPGAASAFILKAVADAESAHSLVNANRAENYPKVIGLGSIGAMAGARLTSVNDTSIGVGLNFPLFEGFRIQSGVQKAQGFETERQEQIKGLKLYVDEANAHYDQSIAYDSARINVLKPLSRLTEKAFSQARERYLNYIGPLVDLRDAIQYLAQVQEKINDSETNLWFNAASKAVLNGGKVSQ